ncbi:hypothetical protein WR25_00113 [Diploscapter pachys]|uniref:3,4-dihydroxy-2-butanone-4-phosphate synthase n=1 Tax=Diploscapter pachys TaxID=2018661 RepID=A0A2A2JYK6_9BILA|nr:hypothetical protein WR25_00113 [Diploscapter pachys]
MNKDVSLHTIVPISILGGDVDAHFFGFNGFARDQEHFAVGIGRDQCDVPLVRVHSECITGDVFGSQRCDCGPQLQEALRTLKEILRALGVDQCRLLTNNPEKVAQLRAGGIDVIEQVPTGVFLTNHNRNYLQAKAVKSAHSIKL